MPRVAAGRAVAVVGAGVRTPAGNSVDELWDALCAGRSFAARFEDERLPPGAEALVGRVTGLDASTYLSAADQRRLDRTHVLAIAAAQDAVDAWHGPLPPPERRGVVVGVGFGASATYEEQMSRLLADGIRGLSPLTVPLVMTSSIAAHLSLRLDVQGPSATVSAACASGAAAIGHAVDLLRAGTADMVVAGGVDSLVNYGGMSSFLRLDAMSRNLACPDLASRPFDVDRDGFVMAEGAGFVALERLADTVAAGREPLGVVAGHASTSDAHHLVAPSPTGDGALRCMRLALEDAQVSAAEISHVNAHGTSTQLNDLAEAIALSELFEGGVTPPVTSIKGSTGHMIGGSGAVEAVVTIESLRRRLAPPIAGLRTLDPAMAIDAVIGTPRRLGPGHGLSNSFGFGGANTALVLGSA